MNDMGLEYKLAIQVGIKFLISIVFGFAALKIYDLFLKAFEQRDRLKIWWAFTSSIFLLFMMLFLSCK